MSGMEPMIIGAVAGAALNRDDPLKGAMMGAALGGGAGGLLGGATGAATGAAAAEAGAMGAAELGAAELGALARPDVAPVLSDFITQAHTTGQVPLTPAFMPEFYPVGAQSGADLGFMNLISPSQQAAIEAGNLPGAMYSPFGGVIGYEEAAGKELARAQAKDAFMRGGGLQNMMSASSGLLRQAQPRAQMQAPGIRRGNPQAVNYGGLASLLEPKLVERRRLSLL